MGRDGGFGFLKMGLVAALGLAAAGAAAPRPAPETLYLDFPQDDQRPEFTLVSVHLLQTAKTMVPPLQDLAENPGLLPAIGVMTLTVAGPAGPLVSFLALRSGLTVTVYDLRSGSSLTLADCRLMPAVSADLGGPSLHRLQLTYGGITFEDADS